MFRKDGALFIYNLCILHIDKNIPADMTKLNGLFRLLQYLGFQVAKISMQVEGQGEV